MEEQGDKWTGRRELSRWACYLGKALGILGAVGSSVRGWGKTTWGQKFKIHQFGTSLEVQWLRLCTSVKGVTVRSLVRNLRSHMSARCGQKSKQRHQLEDPSQADASYISLALHPSCLRTEPK